MAILNSKSVVDSYFEEYEQKLKILFNSKFDIEPTKNVIQEIADKYIDIFSIDSRYVFYSLFEKEKFLALMCLLMNEKTRAIYVPNSRPVVPAKYYKFSEKDLSSIVNSFPYTIQDTYPIDDCKVMLSILANRFYKFKREELVNYLGKNNVLIYPVQSNIDKDDFTEILPSGKRYMILESEQYLNDSLEYTPYLDLCSKKEEIIEGTAFLVITNGIKARKHSSLYKDRWRNSKPYELYCLEV